MADSGTLIVQKAFLVYNIIVLDPNNRVHRIIVDAGNGKILSNDPVFPFDLRAASQISSGTNTTIGFTSNNTASRAIGNSSGNASDENIKK